MWPTSESCALCPKRFVSAVTRTLSSVMCTSTLSALLILRASASRRPFSSNMAVRSSASACSSASRPAVKELMSSTALRPESAISWTRSWPTWPSLTVTERLSVRPSSSMSRGEAESSTSTCGVENFWESLLSRALSTTVGSKNSPSTINIMKNKPVIVKAFRNFITCQWNKESEALLLTPLQTRLRFHDSLSLRGRRG